MSRTLHITSGDRAGDILAKTGISGGVLVLHDILSDGPRNPGWPDADTLDGRALFLEHATSGGLDRDPVLRVLKNQYRKLAAADAESFVLWFDASLSKTSTVRTQPWPESS